MENRTSAYDLINDPTARVVSAEEAERLMHAEAERQAERLAQAAQRKQARLAAAAGSEARRKALQPYREAIAALQPGQDCVIPQREFPLVYRMATELGRQFRTNKLTGGQLRVHRMAATGLGAAEGLM